MVRCKHEVNKMPMTEKQKAARDKYDKENMAYQTVKVQKELLAEFKSLCQANGDRVNTILREAMEKYVEEHRPI